MAVNDQAGQVAVADELAACARMLAHSTRQVLVPSDSYTLLADLTDTVDQLAQVCRQLAGWHARVVDGVDYVGEDPRGGRGDRHDHRPPSNWTGPQPR